MSELDLLRRLAPETAPPTDAERARARAVLVAQIGAAEQAPTRRRRLRLVPAIAVVATAATAAAVFLGVGTKGEESASAAAALRDAATVARSQPPPPELGPGEYLYVKSVTAYLSTSVYSEENWFSVLVPRVREIWFGLDGGRMRETSGKPVFLSERDRREWIEAGRPNVREHAWGGRTEPVQPLDLPSDPDALYEHLERVAAGHPEGVHEEMFTLVGDALRETNASPEQRAALYEVAARIPGVELIGAVKDPAGRAGLAVAMRSEADGIRHTLVFDPATSVLLAEEQVALGDNSWDYPEGTVIGYATYLTTAVVDSSRERPRS